VPKSKYFDSEKNIAIGINPKENFAKGKVMQNKRTGKYDSRFKTLDVGEKDGLRLTIGKTKKDVAKRSPAGAKTKTQRVLIEQEDFEIKNKRLVPKNKSAEIQLKTIRNKFGNVLYLGEEQFIAEKNFSEFEKASYLSKTKGGVKSNRLNKESLERINKLNIPDTTKRKMRLGKEITDIETEILHNNKIEYVRSRKRKSFVREYQGKTEVRMKSLELANKKRGL
jgi:hypothetical protein